MKKPVISLFVVMLMLLLPCGVFANAQENGDSVWVIKFKQNVSIPSAAKLADAEDSDDIDPLSQRDSRYFTTTDPEIAAEFEQSGYCEYVEETDWSYASVVPNDTRYSKPYSVLEGDNLLNIQGQYALNMLNAEKAWDKTLGSKDVNIAVIDTGFDYTHEDGVNINAGWDYLFNANNTKDYGTHGTECAGIIGATTNNNLGISGAAPNCNITMLRCFVVMKGSSTPTANNADIAAAIRDAVDVYDADVISMSFGSLGNNTVLKEAVDYAYNKGAILIAATGNSGAKGSPLEYPAAYHNVIGVGAVDYNKNIAPYSTQNKSTFVVAPGSYILSLSPDQEYNGTCSGTSFATPYVAALAGLAKSVDPNISNYEFSELLKVTAHDLGDSGYDYSYGYGLIDYSGFLTKMSERCFYDVNDNDWYAASVYDLKKAGIITGRTFYTFCPGDSVTRAEFVTLLAKMSTDDLGGFYYRGNFKDVAVNAWYNPYINWAYNNKIVYGMTETTYAPNEKITREEMTTMLCRYVESKKIPLTDKVDIHFVDASSVSLWAKPQVEILTKAGLISGFTDQTFRPHANTTRAEAAALLKRIKDLQS